MPNSNPKLNFSGTEHLTESLRVHAIDLKQARPPFQLTYFDVLPGKSSPQDMHSEHEIWLILEGWGTLYFEGQVFPLEKKDSFYFPSFTQHQVHNHSDSLLIICSIFWSSL